MSDPTKLPIRHLMARDVPGSEPYEADVDWPSRHIEKLKGRRPTELRDLRTEADVTRYRAMNDIPEDATCPRWLDCACKYAKRAKKESEETCGGVQQVWGHSPFCRNCGGLM